MLMEQQPAVSGKHRLHRSYSGNTSPGTKRKTNSIMTIPSERDTAATLSNTVVPIIMNVYRANATSSTPLGIGEVPQRPRPVRSQSVSDLSAMKALRYVEMCSLCHSVRFGNIPRPSNAMPSQVYKPPTHNTGLSQSSSTPTLGDDDGGELRNTSPSSTSGWMEAAESRTHFAELEHYPHPFDFSHGICDRCVAHDSFYRELASPRQANRRVQASATNSPSDSERRTKSAPPSPALSIHPTADSTIASSPTSQASPPTRTQPHILIVEDNELQRKIIQRILAAVNIRCTVASNGAQAVEMFRRTAASGSQSGESFDLVLMDIVMPLMDGKEATRLIRKQGGHMPIIAVTGQGNNECELHNVGFNALFTKPVRRNELLAVVERWLGTATHTFRTSSSPSPTRVTPATQSPDGIEQTAMLQAQ